MKSYNLLILFAFTLLLSACGEDFFEQTIEIDVPEHTPQLAITSQLTAGDTTLWVYVTHSQGILDDSSAKPIEDAVVQLFRDGQLFETIPFLADHFYAKTLASPLPADGAEYQFKISVDGYDPVEAVQQMPKPVPIISATYEPEGALDLDGERVDEISIEFQDPAGEENFYTVSTLIMTEQWGSSSSYFSQLDPLAENLGEWQYLKDASFDGKKYTWRVGIWPQYFQPGQDVKIYVWLYSVSRDHYYYERSVSLSQDANDNPFAEPVIIHGNVTGGQGVFSLSAKSEMVIEP